MGGRSRINKGSKNFDNYIKQSKISKKLFKLFNSKSFYKKIENIFKKRFQNGSWENSNLQKFLIQKNLLLKKN
jgi:hypothetical protein